MEVTEEDHVDYLGFVYGTKAALNRLLPRDRGVIVQVGSALAYRGIPLQSAYCGANRAKGRSVQWWLTSHRREVFGAALGAAGALVVGKTRK